MTVTGWEHLTWAEFGCFKMVQYRMREPLDEPWDTIHTYNSKTYLSLQCYVVRDLPLS